MNLLAQTVTWIKVQKPSFDLVGIVLGSFQLAGMLLLAALVLGIVYGGTLILLRRRPAPRPRHDVSLHLDSRV